MPHSFVKLSPELIEACGHSLVLTTTDRLRRNLLLAYNIEQQQQGRKAWPSPRIQTLDGYLATLHHDLSTGQRSLGPGLPTLLGTEAEHQLFRATAPTGFEVLSGLAQQAWQLSQQWSIPLQSDNFSATEDARLFHAWALRIKHRLQAEGAITRAELPGLSALASGEARLSCVAFEQLPQSYGAWLLRQQADGTVINHIPSASSTPETAARVAFDSASEELTSVAQWARSLLSEAVDAKSIDADGLRIGIVIPDLAQRHTSVVRQFSAEFDPLLSAGTAGLVDIGGGTSLADQPVWLAASNWLRLCFEQLPVAAIRPLLNNIHLTLPAVAAMPANLAPLVNLAELVPHMPALSQLQEQLASRTARPFADWLDGFSDALERAGWLGRRAGSIQFQAYQEVRAHMNALARTAEPRSIPAAAALTELNQFLATVVFAPERPPAPIQIMGYLETTGLRFSHLWILGLDDQSWPQATRLNPFLPSATRRRFGVPRSSPEQETDFAAERLQHWQNSTRTLIVSHVRQRDESLLRPSPLIRALPEVSQFAWMPGRAHPYFSHRHGQLESVDDSHGQPLEPGEHRGGTGRIRDQAICPFKAYATHRLLLKEERTAHGLPDALDRGTLIHEALHRLYEQAGLNHLSAAKLETEAFTDAAEFALRRHYQRFPTPFVDRERLRLIALLQTWNLLESRRENVAIEALELGLSAEFDQIGLRLRIDRIDRINDALIVIDYKTGRVGNRMTRERLVDPQLPLYALCNEDVEGVLYAEVDDSRPRLKGISAHDIPTATLEAPSGGSWSAQRARWQEQINILTKEIRTGLASVSPYEPRACQTCHLSSFCRIDLIPAEAEEQ